MKLVKESSPRPEKGAPPDLSNCLTASEAAVFCGMTYHQLAQRRQRATGPAYFVWKGRIYYRKTALSCWKREAAKVIEVAA